MYTKSKQNIIQTRVCVCVCSGVYIPLRTTINGVREQTKWYYTFISMCVYNVPDPQNKQQFSQTELCL